jgi:hypothetical protein
MQGLVLELLEGQGNLTLNSEAELKNFTIALLKVENNKPLFLF